MEIIIIIVIRYYDLSDFIVSDHIHLQVLVFTIILFWYKAKIIYNFLRPD